MTLLVTALVLAQWLPDNPGRFQRFTSRTEQGRSDRGFDSNALAFFEFAPASGAGMGSACACTMPTGAKGEVLTFARASVGECYSNNGQTLTQCGVGLPRVSSGTATSSWLGLWSEAAAINSIVQSRDLSQAAWTKASMTCALTATGMRYDANAASTCTATGANATVLQTVTAAASVRTGSMHIKRITGAGAVYPTHDGTNFAFDISSQLSTTTWRRVVPQDTPGCAGGNCIILGGDYRLDGGTNGMTGGGANPVLGFKLATSGDSVAVDFVQEEAGDVATTPIATGAAAGSRAIEAASIAHAAMRINSMSALVQIVGNIAAAPTALEDYLDGFNITVLDTPAGTGRAGRCTNYLAGVGVIMPSLWFLPYSSGVPVQVACVFSPTTYHYLRGAPSTSATGQVSAATTTLYVGTDSTGTNPIGGVIKGVKLDPGVNGLGTSFLSPAIAWVGDSLTQGQAGFQASPPLDLNLALGMYVQNYGHGGDKAADCLTRWRQNVSGKNFRTVIVWCGINDIQSGAGASAGTALTSLSTIYTEALAQGMKVIAVGLSPWGTSVNWTAPRGADGDALNASLAAYPGITFVSTASIGTGSPLALPAAIDWGDHLHLNYVGSLQVSALVQAANP